MTSAACLHSHNTSIVCEVGPSLVSLTQILPSTFTACMTSSITATSVFAGTLNNITACFSSMPTSLHQLVNSA